MNSISPDVKFSYDFSKGSIKDRRAKAHMLGQDIFKNSMHSFKKRNSCDIDTFERNFNDALPEGKIIKFGTIEDEYICDNLGELEGIYDDFDNLESFQINVLGDDEKIKLKAIPTIMHETSHLLDFMLNPKYIANDQLMTKKGLYDSPVIDFYEDYIYTFEKKRLSKSKKEAVLKEIESELQQVLEPMSSEDKIIALKFIKNQILTEYYAHVENKLYATVLNNSGRNISPVELNDGPEGYMFKEKLALIVKYLLKAINEERKFSKKKS